VNRDLPLNAVRVFASVGRLLSLKKAADELGVTPSAVSHQISSLEQYLGLRLLRREGNHIVLTIEGTIYLRQVSGNLAQLSRATKWLQATKGQTVLRVAAPPGTASLWLMPRIAAFARAHPDIALNIVSVPDLLMSRQIDRFDVVIRLCADPPAAMHSEALVPTELFPVCSPELLKGRHPLRKPADLCHHTLLECDDDLYNQQSNAGWLDWLQEVKLPEVRSQRYVSFSPAPLMHQALLDGMGVGLMRGLLAADAIASGRLVCPFGPVLSMPGSYYALCEPSIAERPDVLAFRKFLRVEADQTLATLSKARPDGQ
jgi:LysR family transcriptional regulator, glycine cleavage system transcriptional activator